MNKSRKKVAFYTLGCKLNFAETSMISRSFPSDKFERVSANSPADIYVINTCTVTDAADRKCRQAIRKFIGRSPDAVIAVVGCYAQLNPGVISSIPGVDLVLGTNEKFDVAKYLETLDKTGKAEVHSCCISSEEKMSPAFSTGDRTRSFLKVQDGCDYKCSYCTIPLARGPSRNLEIKTLFEEANKIAAEGIKEIVLTGVNIGDFGKTTGESFLQLLEALLKVTGIERYRISSIEPNLISDEIIDLTASERKLLPHFHIPLQSGSDKILKLMKRRYERDLFADKVNKIIQKLPLAAIGADVIVGFPGETDDDFDDTYSFLSNLPLSYLHVFNFSERPGTTAIRLPGKVPSVTREQRSKRLLAMSQKKHNDFCRLNSGTISEVLFEGTRKKGMIGGFTGNYIRVEHEWDPNLCGKIKTVKLLYENPDGNMRVEIID